MNRAGLAPFLERLGRLAPRTNTSSAARSTLLLGWAMQHALCKAGEISIGNLESFENRTGEVKVATSQQSLYNRSHF